MAVQDLFGIPVTIAEICPHCGIYVHDLHICQQRWPFSPESMIEAFQQLSNAAETTRRSFEAYTKAEAARQEQERQRRERLP